jgi:hypothetical protein
VCATPGSIAYIIGAWVWISIACGPMGSIGILRCRFAGDAGPA